MKHQMSQMQQAQNLMLQNLMNNMCQCCLARRLTIQHHYACQLSSPISPNCMFSFLFMNIAHLYAKYRHKTNFLADYCDSSTMFICLCETFLHEGILDSEVQIPGFIIVRSDRVSRPGGGVCLYLRKNIIYKTQ